MRFTSLLLLFMAGPAIAAEAVSFRNEVMAVLSRAGCNQGACHGNLNGKGGLKLSLRGEDPSFDWLALTRDTLARRVNVLNPTESLLLRKATGRVPHEGGARFDPTASEYQVLHRWIAQGATDDGNRAPRLTKLAVTPTQQVLIAPADRTRLQATAHFADGQTRDMTSLVCFDTSAVGIVNVLPTGEVVKQRDGELTIAVRYLNQQVPVTLAFIPPREQFTWQDIPLTNLVDQHLYPQWKAHRLTPAPLSDDGTFLRRLYLDVLGVLPSADLVQTFLADKNPKKRERFIDDVLQRPEFADYWAQKWADLLRNEEKALDRKGVRVFHQWIRDAIAAGKPMNSFAKEIIVARGSTYQNPPANLYRSLREPYARAESIAQVFLGIRLQCAKCHNHPFDRWTQTDYHEFAAVFGRIDYRIVENNRKDRLDKHEFDGEQIVFTTRENSVRHPRTKDVLNPRLLDAQNAISHDDPLEALATWIADPANPFFAKAQVNRVWFHLFGRGLVEPSDDFRASNPAVNEALLNELAQFFVKNKFDLRTLVRLIVNSRAYQLAATPGATNADDDTHFSKAMIQPLEAEQLLDAVAQVTGSRPKFDGFPHGTRAGQLAALPPERRGRRGAGVPERFLKVFGKPERLLTCECERSDDAGLMQAFTMLTGEMLQEMLGDENNALSQAIASGESNSAIVERFYLAALARGPNAKETQHLTALLDAAKDRRRTLEDIVWGLVNSKEFLLRR